MNVFLCNEKMYLVIWIWLVLLMVISLPYILFRISTVLFDNVRFALLMGSGEKPNGRLWTLIHVASGGKLIAPREKSLQGKS